MAHGFHPAGYYHSNYDLLSWIRLGDQLRTKTLLADPMERAGVITDAFSAALAGKAEAWLPLFLLSTDLVDEYKAAPWQAAYSGLRAYAALVKADPDIERLFQVGSATTECDHHHHRKTKTQIPGQLNPETMVKKVFLEVILTPISKATKRVFEWVWKCPSNFIFLILGCWVGLPQNMCFGFSVMVACPAMYRLYLSWPFLTCFFRN